MSVSPQQTIFNLKPVTLAVYERRFLCKMGSSNDDDGRKEEPELKAIIITIHVLLINCHYFWQFSCDQSIL